MTPDKHTIAEHMLEVGHEHTLYIQDWGNKKAKTPIFFLHGGPGAQCKNKHKLPFDPVTQRVIFHDQRGSGKSTPLGRWHHNNTQELAADITKIADYLKIDQFIITGGSWGSTLALYYSICEPRRVKGIVIDGVFTGSQAEIDWVDKGLFRAHFPDAWEHYLAATPKKYWGDPSAYHIAQALGTDEAATKKSAHAYEELERSIMSLDDNFLPSNPEDFEPEGMLIEMRYLRNRCFLPDRFILKNAGKLKMPLYIIQGRYDFVCPPQTAYELSKIAPIAHLTWVINGHKGEHEVVSVKRLIYRHLTEGK
ncbi:alpha/beta fold hydrolase [Candidatus Saccharibacteria bacterium]|nr:MAG: alpha/beta fold hydrolase [Candidatus Saccharibacteria bacterium]